MARARALRPTYFTHDRLAPMHPLARILFAGLWCEADRMGRLEDRPLQLKMRYLPLDQVDVKALLDQLETEDLIARYEVDGVALIWIPGFFSQQKGFTHPNETASDLPRHPSDTNEETGPKKPEKGAKKTRGPPRGSARTTKEVLNRAGSSGSSGSAGPSGSSGSSGPAGREDEPPSVQPEQHRRNGSSAEEWFEDYVEGGRADKLREVGGVDVEPLEKIEGLKPALINAIAKRLCEWSGLPLEPEKGKLSVTSVWWAFLEDPKSAGLEVPYSFRYFSSEGCFRRYLEQLQREHAA